MLLPAGPLHRVGESRMATVRISQPSSRRWCCRRKYTWVDRPTCTHPFLIVGIVSRCIERFKGAGEGQSSRKNIFNSAVLVWTCHRLLYGHRSLLCLLLSRWKVFNLKPFEVFVMKAARCWLLLTLWTITSSELDMYFHPIDIQRLQHHPNIPS